MKKHNKPPNPLRLVRWTLFLLLGILLLIPQNTTALVSGCRTDPIVSLTNGDQLRIIVQVNAPENQIKSVDYTLHAPPGVQTKKIVYTAGGLGKRERFTLVNDEQPGYYTVEVAVKVTGNNSADVSVTTEWTSTAYDATVSGSDGDTLYMRLGP